MTQEQQAELSMQLAHDPITRSVVLLGSGIVAAPTEPMPDPSRHATKGRCVGCGGKITRLFILFGHFWISDRWCSDCEPMRPKPMRREQPSPPLPPIAPPHSEPREEPFG
jgi:hypothetical protein